MQVRNNMCEKSSIVICIVVVGSLDFKFVKPGLKVGKGMGLGSWRWGAAKRTREVFSFHLQA